MNPAVLILSACCALPTSTVEQHGVRIETGIDASIYTWTITNVDAPPIMSVQISQQRTYDASAPDGWEIEQEGTVRAWTDLSRFAINPGQSKIFTARVVSAGAVLVFGEATIGFGEGHEPITVAEVWVPKRLPMNLCLLIAATVAGIGLLHVSLVARRERARRPVAQSRAS